MERLQDGEVAGWRGSRMERLQDGEVAGWRGCRMERLQDGEVAGWRGCRMERLRDGEVQDDDDDNDDPMILNIRAKKHTSERTIVPWTVIFILIPMNPVGVSRMGAMEM